MTRPSPARRAEGNNCIFLVIGGRLGDRYGKRRLYLIGIVGFTAASLLCGLAADPAMIIAGRLGFITASIAGRPLLERLGRTLVIGGLAATLAGALGLCLTVHKDGTAVTGYLTIPSVLVLGLDMGTFITSVYFDVSAAHGGVTAMTVSCFTVAMIIVACLGLVWLLPRNAAPEELPDDVRADGRPPAGVPPQDYSRIIIGADAAEHGERPELRTHAKRRGPF